MNKKPFISNVLRCFMHLYKDVPLQGQINTYRYQLCLKNTSYVQHFQYELRIIWTHLSLSDDNRENYSTITDVITHREKTLYGDYFDFQRQLGYDPFDPANKHRYS